MKRAVLTLLLPLLLQPYTLFGQFTSGKAAAGIDSLLRLSFFDTTLAAVNIYNLTKGKPLYARNDKMLLHPASNMKILTSAAGLCFLGADFLFTTGLYYTGSLRDSVVTGNLYVTGGCDPDLTDADLQQFVSRLSELGVRRVEGGIFADVSMTDSVYWGTGWMWDDDPSTDFPYMTALCLNDNAVTVTATPGEPGTAPKVTITPATSFVTVSNEAITTAEGRQQLLISRDVLHRNNGVIIKGKISAAGGSVTERVNIMRPDLYLLTVLREQLQSAGITIAGAADTAALPEGATLAGSIQRPYREVIVNLNKASDNLSAEMTLRQLAYLRAGKRAPASAGIQMIDSLLRLAEFSPANYRMVDGSGVSHYNLISADLVSGLLRYIYYAKPEIFPLLDWSFPFAGVDGTLRNRMKGTAAYDNVHAKTGTLSGVSCLSGYVHAATGDLYAFSVFMQNHVRNTNRCIDYQNRICELIALIDGE